MALVSALAKHKAEAAPPLLRAAAQAAWADRWWSLLGVASQKAVATSLLAVSGKGLVLDSPSDEVLPLDALLDSQRWA